jgi:hypothetical protein
MTTGIRDLTLALFAPLTVIERIYAPDESNFIPQCSAGPGGTRPDLLVLQVGRSWQGNPSGM